jgi:nucleotide-binding universal stress UspA family protein
MEINKVIVPIDFSDYSKKAFGYAIDFSKHFNASITLVYVVEPQIYPADFTMGQVAIPNVDANLSEAAEKELLTLIDSTDFDKSKIDYKIRIGQPFHEIIEAAAELDADLIIIATHGHTGVEHLLFGSTAEKVVRKAPCPVLTLREPIKGFRYKNA